MACEGPVGRRKRLPALRDQIQRLLALPPERRTHFLRKRIGVRMSCI
jgi:hypothetical protein